MVKLSPLLPSCIVCLYASLQRSEAGENSGSWPALGEMAQKMKKEGEKPDKPPPPVAPPVPAVRERRVVPVVERRELDASNEKKKKSKFFRKPRSWSLLHLCCLFIDVPARVQSASKPYSYKRLTTAF